MTRQGYPGAYPPPRPASGYSGGRNFLIPVDAQLESDADLLTEAPGRLRRTAH